MNKRQVNQTVIGMAGNTMASRQHNRAGSNRHAPLYSPEQRRRRDATGWTTVQGVLAPVQLIACLISMGLISYWFRTGDGLAAATYSVVVKTALLYTIMVTGAIWEKRVFGRYLFAPAFFWEDVVSMVVMVLHTLFLLAWLGAWLDTALLLKLALLAYAAYLVNAAQFLFKLRLARLERLVIAGDPLQVRSAGSLQ